jgi:hypothetical protein
MNNNMPDVECFCNTCAEEDNYYECEGCKRIVPYCFGASDRYYEYCDDCALYLSRGVSSNDLYNIINNK